MKKSENYFNIFSSKYIQEEYNLPPWIENLIEKCIEDFFYNYNYDYNNIANIILIEIESFLKKTYLPISLKNWLDNEKLVNFTFLYFITSPNITIDNIKEWIESQIKNIEKNNKIIIIIDGIELLPQNLEKDLNSLLKEYLPILFFIFNKKNSILKIHYLKKIEISHNDLILFFVEEHIKELLEKYKNQSNLSKNILSNLFNSYPNYLSIPELSQKLNIFSPKLLKEILKLKQFIELKENKVRLLKDIYYYSKYLD